MPMPRRIPKRGFKNPNRVEAFPINVATLDKLFDAGATSTSTRSAPRASCPSSATRS
jgi:ribosomal protein L15